ncbi:uncharacterized protein F5Z01DRAFT_81268 [Emericellopsis atlantica]|uniref:Uncharacterized protein n=1 Tax=Emericellopsis atlantica TaxID=2614577 RepID=A0A9P8CRD4_9HYPO|nr:uncharacterized protein F5Z01DRAFT_81268 [Emericellopsis atlantica]KAG9254596.1 hypothetical protein F5Z01DRAFT_81268 [Emericellopsis atlantica]
MFASPWVWEVSSLAGVIATFAGLVTLLAMFDGRPIFDWKSITLNTIVSTLSLILRAFLLYPIAECVGQWKWILFSRSKRSLKDFERIDSASRGPLGCLCLSWQRNVPWILRLGAVVSVLALAVDPFSQQLVQVETKVVKIQEQWEKGDPGIPTYSPRAMSYRRGHLSKANETSPANESSDSKVVHMEARPALSMAGAILKSLSSWDGLIVQGLNYDCTDSKCTWPPFQTLAVCSRCQNVASQLRRVENFGDMFRYMEDLGDGDIEIQPGNATAVALPNGHFLANLNGCLTEKSALEDGCKLPGTANDTIEAPSNVASFYGTSDPNHTMTMQDLDTMIWSTTALYVDDEQRRRGHLPPDWDGPGGELDDYYRNSTDPIRKDTQADLSRWPYSPVQAEECALFYCVQTIEETYELSTLYDRITELPDFTRKTDSWQPRAKGDLSPENIPPNPKSLEFDNKYAAMEMTDLVLHYNNKSAERTDFNLSHAAIMSISAYFQEIFRIPWTNESEAFGLVRDRIPDASVLPNGRIRSHNLHEPTSLEGLYTKEFPSMRNKISNLALGMTVEMRNDAGDSHYYSTGTSGVDKHQDVVIGSTHVSTVIYRAEWYWISLHGVIVSFGVLFCVMTMLSTTTGAREQTVWKNHSLATLRQGADIGQRLSAVATLRDLDKAATDYKVTIPSTQSAKALLPDE